MNRIEEFWYCVASQEELPLFKGKAIDDQPCKNLLALVNLYKTGVSQEEIDSYFEKYGTVTSREEAIIRLIVLKFPKSINDLRVLVGVSDKRLYLDLSYLVHIFVYDDNKRLVPENREHLLKHDTDYFIKLLKTSNEREVFASLIAGYFVNRGIVDILNTFISLSNNQIIQIFNNLIAPKEIQQMQAKYRGHGAEQAFAKIVRKCELQLFPEEKDIDPMSGYDPNVDLSTMTIVPRDAKNPNCHSFDLVIFDSNHKVKVLIQSLIHSSDPGQYGVNKSDETIQIQKLVSRFNSNKNEKDVVYLLGSVDGVGFSENPNGTIVKMIDAFDDFFQMNTLFKIPLFLQAKGLISSVKGIVFDLDYFDIATISYFEQKYLIPAGVSVMPKTVLNPNNHYVAGKACVVVKD